MRQSLKCKTLFGRTRHTVEGWEIVGTLGCELGVRSLCFSPGRDVSGLDNRPEPGIPAFSSFNVKIHNLARGELPVSNRSSEFRRRGMKQ